MKNGLLGKGAITSNGQTKAVTNTCAFDALIQIMLFAVVENAEFKNQVEEIDNPFLRLVLTMQAKGLQGPSLYKQRTALLYTYLGNEKEIIETKNHCTQLNCATSATYAAQTMFKTYPSCKEVSACAERCIFIEKDRITITLTYEDLLTDNFNEVINERLSLDERLCPHCLSMVVTSVTNTGNMKNIFRPHIFIIILFQLFSCFWPLTTQTLDQKFH